MITRTLINIEVAESNTEYHISKLIILRIINPMIKMIRQLFHVNKVGGNVKNHHV